METAVPVVCTGVKGDGLFLFAIGCIRVVKYYILLGI